MSTVVKKPTKTQIPTSADFPSWAHPLNLFWESEWMMLRDTLIGEKQVKSRGTEYLAQYRGFDDDEYRSYLERASFYNMVARTVSGMLGTLFRRNPVVSNIPASIDISRIGYEGESLWTQMRNAGQELIHVGRLGGLVDRDPNGTNEPYIAH